MCMIIDPEVKKLNKRVVWKIFDLVDGKIVSLFQGATYRKGKLVTRDAGVVNDDGMGYHGLHFFRSKAKALREAKSWSYSYIAQFAVDPKDFLFASDDGNEAMYEKATRIGDYIKVRGK